MRPLFPLIWTVNSTVPLIKQADLSKGEQSIQMQPGPSYVL